MNGDGKSELVAATDAQQESSCSMSVRGIAVAIGTIQVSAR
jgi:hypothetical protein